MKTIWKYEWAEELELPKGARVLSANYQNSISILYLWAIVDPKAPKEKRHFVLIPTGQGMTIGDSDQLVYINTVFQGPFVWHVFEKIA
jgi:hypothetical protein